MARAKGSRRVVWKLCTWHWTTFANWFPRYNKLIPAFFLALYIYVGSKLCVIVFLLLYISFVRQKDFNVCVFMLAPHVYNNTSWNQCAFSIKVHTFLLLHTFNKILYFSSIQQLTIWYDSSIGYSNLCNCDNIFIRSCYYVYGLFWVIGYFI